MPRSKWATSAIILSGALGGVCLGIACVVLARAVPRGAEAIFWVLEALWIVCGISWDRAYGGTGILGGALGGLGGGLALVGLLLLQHRDQYEILGELAFCFSGVWGLLLGAGFGLNVWLYLGKPFLRENASGILGMLQKGETWCAAGLFLSATLLTTSAILVSAGR